MAINTDRQEALRLIEDLNEAEFEQKKIVPLTNTQRQNVWAWPLVYGERD